MTKEQLDLLGFEFESLPSGRINIYHKECFILNGTTCVCATRGKWSRTLEVKGIDDACNYIKTIEFLTDFV